MADTDDRSHVPLIAVAGGVALALWFLLRGGPFGLGRGGAGVDERPRCTIRLSPTALSVDGATSNVDDAVARCKHRGADVIVTGDAREGDWIALRDALDAAHVMWSRRNNATSRRWRRRRA